MSKLRRHDWRGHREIMCNRCGDYLPSRQELKIHRESKHEMIDKVVCRHFPNCLDEDECLYVHDKMEDSRSNVVTSLVDLLTKSTKKIRSCANSKGIVIDSIVHTDILKQEELF